MRFIGTGVERFEGEERKMAESAYLRSGESATDVPGPGIWTTAYHVTAVKECPITPALMIEARLNPGTPPPSTTFDVPCFPQSSRPTTS